MLLQQRLSNVSTVQIILGTVLFGRPNNVVQGVGQFSADERAAYFFVRGAEEVGSFDSGRLLCAPTPTAEICYTGCIKDGLKLFINYVMTSGEDGGLP